MSLNRRSLLTLSAAVAASPKFALAAPVSRAVVTFLHNAPVLDPTGLSEPYRAAPADAHSLPDQAYAWRPFL